AGADHPRRGGGGRWRRVEHGRPAGGVTAAPGAGRGGGGPPRHRQRQSPAAQCPQRANRPDHCCYLIPHESFCSPDKRECFANAQEKATGHLWLKGGHTAWGFPGTTITLDPARFSAHPSWSIVVTG